jgi:hypothetical protein
MHTYRDAKRMAKVLETSLREKNVDISHGESLNIIARQFGLDDWNTLSARIKRAEAADVRRLQAIQAWDFVGEHPTEFDYGVDENALGSSRRAALIRYMQTTPTRYSHTARVFGTLMQSVSAVPYHGKRLEICADLSTEHVSHGATIWARVDKSAGHSLVFDNLKNHPNGWLFGDNSWTKRRIILDVPPEGVSLTFGFFLKGKGSVWAANFALKIVENTVPLTAPPMEATTREPNWATPKNMDFAKIVDLTS